jgi:hypothetical protein
MYFGAPFPHPDSSADAARNWRVSNRNTRRSSDRRRWRSRSADDMIADAGIAEMAGFVSELWSYLTGMILKAILAI